VPTYFITVNNLTCLDNFKIQSIHDYFAVIYTENNVIRIVHICIIAAAIKLLFVLLCRCCIIIPTCVCINLRYIEGQPIQLSDAFSELILKKETYINYFKQLRKESQGMMFHLNL